MGKFCHSYILIVFFIYSDKPYAVLKPGQTKLSRDYYKEVTTDKPEGDVILNNYARFKSIYDQN
jgi:hypothetical protein